MAKPIEVFNLDIIVAYYKSLLYIVLRFEPSCAGIEWMKLRRIITFKELNMYRLASKEPGLSRH
jgi:hypothetical protein